MCQRSKTRQTRRCYHTYVGRCNGRGTTPRKRAKSVIPRTRLLDKVVCQLPAGHVVLRRIKIRHAPADFAAVILNVVSEFANLTARSAAGVLQEGAVPSNPVIAVDAHARDLLAVAVPAAGINVVDTAREPSDDPNSSGPATVARSPAVEPESVDEGRPENGEEEELGEGGESHLRGRLCFRFE